MGCRMVEKSRRLALSEGIIAGILFGTAAMFIRLTDINVFSIALWRLIIAFAVMLFMILVLKGKLNTRLIRSNFRHFLVLGMLLATHFILFVSAVKNTARRVG